jgi:hypothetical protein
MGTVDQSINMPTYEFLVMRPWEPVQIPWERQPIGELVRSMTVRGLHYFDNGSVKCIVAITETKGMSKLALPSNACTRRGNQRPGHVLAHS